MAHPQHNFTSNFNGSDGHNAELTLNINGVEKKYTPAGNDQTYNVPGVARIDINLDGSDLVQAIQTVLDGAAQPVLVERSIYDEEYVYQYIGDIDGQWYFGTCTTNKIVTITVAKEDGAVNGEQIPVANGVVIVESDSLNVYSRLRTAIALGQLPVLSYVGANPVYAQYEKTANNGDLIFVGALATASDTYVQYNIYTVSDNNTVTVTTRAASAGGGGTPDNENGFFNSSLYQTPGDGVTKSLTLNDFRIKQGTSIHGSNIEFVPTHQEGGIDFGEVYLNPGTYILNIRYTLQWIGNPRGTFLPLVCKVGTQPFDFSFEQENTLITSQIRVVTARQKVSVAFPFDADTPPMGIWVETLSIAQLASNTHPAVVHDTTLAGSGTAGSPLGVTTDAFGKIKDIPTSISQFRAGDVIPVDGPNGPTKMTAETLLELTAQNALAGNVAPAFDPTRDAEHPYLVGEVVIEGGELYECIIEHSGAWVPSHFRKTSSYKLLLDTAVAKLDCYFKEPAITWTANNCVRYDNGELFSNNGYSASSEIDVEGWVQIDVSYYAEYLPDIRGCAFYDSNHQFIKGIRYTNNGENNDIIDVQQNAKYFRFTTKSTNIVSSYARRNDVYSYIDELASYFPRAVPTWTGGYCIRYDNGELFSVSEYAASSEINVDGWAKVNIVYYAEYLPDIRGCAFYDASHKFIKGIRYTNNGDNSDVIDVPQGAKYLRFTTKSTNIASSYVRFVDVVASVLNVRDSFEQVIPFSMFVNFAVCGDSFSAGSVFASGSFDGDFPLICWGKILSRISGVELYNYSSGGADTRNFRTRAECLPKILTDPARDLYILCLGINDYGQSIPVGDVSTDIDDDNPENNEDTFVGNYGYIIAKIKEHAPSAKLVIIKSFLPSYRSSPSAYYSYGSTAIEQLAAHFGILYAETIADPFFNSLKYNGGIIGGHPTAPLYAGMANAIKSIIEVVFWNNTAYLRDYKPV